MGSFLEDFGQTTGDTGQLLFLLPFEDRIPPGNQTSCSNIGISVVSVPFPETTGFSQTSGLY